MIESNRSSARTARGCRYGIGHVLVASALAACSPSLTQQSVAPPGRSARLDSVDGFWGTKYYRLEVSQGVALAITCDKGTPCEHLHVASENPAVAEVRLASLAALETVGFSATTPAAAFVVIGKAPGATKLHVTAKEGDRDVVITVVSSPPPPSAQTAAQ